MAATTGWGEFAISFPYQPYHRFAIYTTEGEQMWSYPKEVMPPATEVTYTHYEGAQYFMRFHTSSDWIALEPGEVYPSEWVIGVRAGVGFCLYPLQGRRGTGRRACPTIIPIGAYGDKWQSPFVGLGGFTFPVPSDRPLQKRAVVSCNSILIQQLGFTTLQATSRRPQRWSLRLGRHPRGPLRRPIPRFRLAQG